MPSISSVSTITVNVAAPQRNIVHVKPVTNVQTISKPQPIVNDIKVIQIARPVTNTETVVQATNIVKTQPNPQVMNTQSLQTITSPINTESYSGSSVDIYV